MSARGPGGRERLHGSALRVGERGVLIRGASGSGKSSLLLSLLRRAPAGGLPARLLADDQVIVIRDADGLWMHAPEATAGLLEVRGVGILRLPYQTPGRLDLVVDLGGRDELQRLPEPRERTVPILRVEVPRIRLPARDPAFGADVIVTLLGCGARPLRTD